MHLQKCHISLTRDQKKMEKTITKKQKRGGMMVTPPPSLPTNKLSGGMLVARSPL